MLEKEGVEEKKVERETVNAYDQLKKAKEAGLMGPFLLISYFSDTGRGGIGQYWVVDRPGFILDKQAHWAMRGKKAFDLYNREGSFGTRKVAALAEAQAWVKERYGEVEWAKNGRGDYLPAHINKAFPVSKSSK